MTGKLTVPFGWGLGRLVKNAVVCMQALGAAKSVISILANMEKCDN